MPKEEVLKQKARVYFKNKGYQVWFAPRTRWTLEKDIFGIWDCICWKKNKFIFVQITTLKNKSARLKKIVNYMLPNYLYFSPPNKGIILAWVKREKKFREFEV